MSAPMLFDSRPHGLERRRRARVRPHAPHRAVRLSLGMINRLVRVADGLVAASIILTIRAVGPGEPRLQTLIATAVSAVIFVAVLDAVEGYRVERYRRPVSQALELMLGAVMALSAGQVLLAPLSVTALMAGFLALTSALMIERALADQAVYAMERSGLLRRRVAIVGATAIADHILSRIRSPDAQGDYESVGLFDDRDADRPRTGQGPITGNIADLRRLAQNSRIDLIVLALPWRDTERLFQLGEKVQWISADIVTPVDDPGFLTRSSVITQIAGLPALQLTRHPFRGTQGLVKLVQDYVVAAVGLLLAAPVMLAAAAALRLSGGGPILFRQQRIGFNGRPFCIYKFRSMSVEVGDDGAGVAFRDNPRVTRLGALLRRTSIDELPQLFNVLRGEMSIVGPRPHVANMRIADGPYADLVRTYAARHQVRPGITGWAQINGMRGGIDTLDKARRGVDLDLHYMRNWSLQLDVRIILRTLTLHMAGAEVF